jgi:hypothetical protein
MPRNSSGVYTLVAGNPVASGETIASDWANTTLADIQQALTDSLDRLGRGGMLAPFRFADGTLLEPSWTWVNEPASGLYRAANQDHRYVMAGSPKWRTTNANPFQIRSGSTWVSPILDEGTISLDRIPTLPASKLENYPNNTISFLRGDGTWSDQLTSGLSIGGSLTLLASGYVGRSATGPRLQVFEAAADLRGADVNGLVRVWTSGVERVRVASDGNVGVGTSNPQSKFSVLGNSRFQGLVGVGQAPGLNSAAVSLGVNGRADVGENGTSSQAVITLDHSGGISRIRSTSWGGADIQPLGVFIGANESFRVKLNRGVEFFNLVEAVDYTSTLRAVGFREAALVSNPNSAGNYTITDADSQKVIRLGLNSTNVTYTLSNSVPTGTMCVVAVRGQASTITFTAGSGAELRWYKGAGMEVGNRVVGSGAVVTLLKITSSEWAIYGSGIT